ncbi:MAG: aminotransferase class I/II-fold pyridoxal phosphate-dependent enzyme [Anaerolineae bacterium]|nr:aminotransferase class I/II-fold pyridoxal phosphate-dependent enzyme [Anaerolineae bacterium]
MKPAARMESIKPYFFSSLGKRIVEMRKNGVDVIRLDMGSPDLPPEGFIIDALVDAARDSGMHGYTLGSGTQAYRRAAAAHYQRRFGVDLDPGSEVIDLIGSKEGLFIISQVLLEEGDVALVPDPAYGVYATGAKVAGAEVYKMPLLAENGFLPDLEAIPAEVAAKAKLLWLNYPNNPTGAVADIGFFKSVVDFARQNDMVVAHDAPYTEVCFDGYVAPSLLEVAGAKDVAVEFNSLSKAYNMAGWRLGMAMGNGEILKMIEAYKSQKDSAVFAPILAAGAAALEGDQTWTDKRNMVYKERQNLVVEGLRQSGFEVAVPKAALYVWVPIPDGGDSMDFCARMLDEIGVSTTPGVVFGQYGEGYLRISLVTSTERLSEGVERIVVWMKGQR